MKSNGQLTNIIIALHQRGFNHDFIVEKEHIRCLQYNELISPNDFEIMETYHNESKRKLENGSAVYAIRLTNYNINGILISSYQSYINGISIKLLAKFNNVMRLNVLEIQMAGSL